MLSRGFHLVLLLFGIILLNLSGSTTVISTHHVLSNADLYPERPLSNSNQLLNLRKHLLSVVSALTPSVPCGTMRLSAERYLSRMGHTTPSVKISISKLNIPILTTLLVRTSCGITSSITYVVSLLRTPISHLKYK